MFFGKTPCPRAERELDRSVGGRITAARTATASRASRCSHLLCFEASRQDAPAVFCGLNSSMLSPGVPTTQTFAINGHQVAIVEESAQQRAADRRGQLEGGLIRLDFGDDLALSNRIAGLLVAIGQSGILQRCCRASAFQWELPFNKALPAFV